jgi:hypothetical protein
MPTDVTNKTGNIELRLAAYHDCDDVQLCWRAKVGDQLDAAIPGCLGFMLERQRQDGSGAWGATEVLRNRVGFPAPAGTPPAPTQPSNIWPFQRFDWTDHGANCGQTVRYRVSAVVMPAAGTPGVTLLNAVADSGWTEAIEVTADCGSGTSAYFNRGFVMSQFVARKARQNGWQAGDIKKHAGELQDPLRVFLSGELRLALLRLLDEVAGDPGLALYTALYELSDDELIGRLKQLGGRAHVVLSNGSSTPDGNANSRAVVKQAGVDVRDRLLGSKGLGHNKFAVVVRSSDGAPLKAWTGSTNWAPTGLCTQVNNGLLIEDGAAAKVYMDQWNRLASAGSDFPPALVTANSASPYAAAGAEVWFTRVTPPAPGSSDPTADIKRLQDVVNSARSAILYIMFEPGPEPLTSILKRMPDIYVRGVVSTVPSADVNHFSLVGIDTKSREYETALVQPEGIGHDFSAWVGELARTQFLSSIGFAITHAKVIVIDPFDDNCKVVTGSHNFSKSASEKNDENFVVIEGNRALAEAYAVACLDTYDHYRWRAYVKEQTDANQTPWENLSITSDWQTGYVSPLRKQHLDVWCPWP